MTGGRTVIIVQARMGSTRLPGKSMLPLAGEPLVARLLERLQRVTQADEIVLALPDKPEDDVLAKVAVRLGVSTFRGAEDDLVDRFYQAAHTYGAQTIVRIPGDNPAPEPAEIDRVIRYHRESGNDFSSNYPDVFDNGYPDGIGAEVFGFAPLERLWKSVTDPRNREHPHTNFYEHSDTFRIGTIECPAEFRRPDIVLDVNTREEYEFMASLYSALYPANPRFTILDIIEWYDGVYMAHAGMAR
jgi:spore coat polysaccharide biosynthesis protein SpsF